MSVIKGVVIRGLCALALGGLAVFAFTLLLGSYGAEDAPEQLPQTAARELTFPENEKMLHTLSEQLDREAKEFSKISPAAGGKDD